MRLPESVAHSFQILTTQIQFAIVYLQTHPLVHYMIITTILVVALLLVISLRKRNTTAETLEDTNTIAPRATTKDINAIAGEDIIATQLDLAKAYIEMNQKKLANRILQQALKQGSAIQQQEARQLLASI